jgi:murein L,D-transpeptidase YafK
MVKRLWVAAGMTLAVSGCQDAGYSGSTKHLAPIPPATLSLMAAKSLDKSDPILIRAYKKESEFEVWKKGSDGKYALLKTFPICRWSGQLGPKVREGDRQAPEGFYSINPAQMNPNSAYYLSFDTGYPNAFDRAHGRTGAHLMVHGTCSSSGCFAMTDEAISEVYAIGRESFAGGQRAFQFQSYPFRMTAENLAKHRHDPNMPFWKNLKEGSDYFEALREEPKVGLCNGRYTFGGSDVANGSCSPQVEPAVAQKRERDERDVAELVQKGIPAVRVVYQDGGQHASFTETMTASARGADTEMFAVLDSRPRRNLGDVSRPEALAMGPREIPIGPNGKPADAKPATALAFAPAKTPEAKPLLLAAKTSDDKNPAAKAKASPTALAGATGPEKPKRIEVASADADDMPLYKKMLGSLTASASAPATNAKVAQDEPAATFAPASPAKPPLPPRRKTVAASPKPAPTQQPAASPAAEPQKPASKPTSPAAPAPQAATPAPEKRVDLLGPSRIAPSTSFAAFTPAN